MVEFALSLTVVMYMIMGIVDFGRGFLIYNVVASTARETARYGIVSSRTSTELVNYGTAQAGIDGVTVTVVSRGTAGNATSPVVVEVTSTFTPITPLIAVACCAGGPLSLAARSSMYVEP